MISMEGERYITTSEIARRLGVTIPTTVLERLGFHYHQSGVAKLWRERDFPAMCRAIADDILSNGNAGAHEETTT